MAINVSGADIARFFEQLTVKREKLRQQLDEVEKEYDAVATTLKLMGQPTQGALSLNLSEMTQLEALISIAKANGGIVAVKTARRMMTKAGLFKSPKNGSSIIFTAISRSKKFKKHGPGKYRLLSEQEIQQAKITEIPAPMAVEA